MLMDGGREDVSKPDNDDETRAMKCGDYVESGDGNEDDSNSDGNDECACTYIGGTNYVALTGEEKGRD